MTEKHYRYYDTLYESGPKINLMELDVVRHTPKGVVINLYGTEKFVLNGIGKRFSHSTKDAAMHSYLKRKERQASIYYHRHQKAETCAKLAAWMIKNGKHLDRYEAFGEMDIPWEPIS